MGTYTSNYTGKEIDNGIKKITELVVPTKVSELSNDKGYIRTQDETDPIYSQDKPNIALKSEIPTKLSQLQNDAYYIDQSTLDHEHDAILSSYATIEYVEQEIAKFDFIKVVDSLPETGLPNRIYFVPKTDTQTQDLFDEYAWINDKWEFITTKQIEVDMTKYATIDYVDGLIGDIESLLQEV